MQFKEKLKLYQKYYNSVNYKENYTKLKLKIYSNKKIYKPKNIDTKLFGQR